MVQKGRIMDRLKKLTSSYWFMWLTLGCYIFGPAANTIAGHLIAIGRDNFKKWEWFDTILLGCQLVVGTTFAIRALYNQDLKKINSVNVNDKGGTENATKPL